MSWMWLKQLWLTSSVPALSMAAPAAAWAGDAPAAVEITLHVPAGARVWFDGGETMQTGAERVFVSPPLEPGRDYTYEVRVQWRDGEQLVERTRRLAVRAGDHVGLNYAGRAFVEVRPYADEAPPAAPAPVIRSVPAYERAPYERGPGGPPPAPHFYDPGPRPGPPGSNDPMSLGAGNG
jgi:uncharacterized protein (TIGR03000 family)